MYNGRNAYYRSLITSSRLLNIIRRDWNWITHFNPVKIVVLPTAWLKIHIDNLTILEVSFLHSYSAVQDLATIFNIKKYLNKIPLKLFSIWSPNYLVFHEHWWPYLSAVTNDVPTLPPPSGPTYLGSIYLLLHSTLLRLWCMSWFRWGTFWIHCVLLEVDILHIGKT